MLHPIVRWHSNDQGDPSKDKPTANVPTLKQNNDDKDRYGEYDPVHSSSSPTRLASRGTFLSAGIHRFRRKRSPTIGQKPSISAQIESYPI